MESFHAKPRSKRREKYATGKRTSKNSVISKKNKIILLWLLGSFQQVIVGYIVFEVLLSAKYNFLILSFQCFRLLLIFDRAMLSYKRRFEIDKLF